MEEEVAQVLLDVKAVTLNCKKPYTFVSGIKSPIYCDNRLILSYPPGRKTIIHYMKEIISKNKLHADVIAGTATSAIPYAAWLAHELDLPLIYIRKNSKDYGKEKLVEGVLTPGQHVIVIEDLITSGGSALNSVQAVREIGGIVNSVIAIFTYGFEKSRKAFEEARCNLYTLTNFHILIPVAAQKGFIKEEEVKDILEWSSDPTGWGKRMGF
ncbi:orotate phosphoribosyltransferase [Candidatus Woesearchaeota archaeon]|nr:orotate phosphoribosyltransferase [Candidatus Woesearchaeota archaeon]